MALYEWNRYWCSREGQYGLTNEGFLRPPHKKYGDPNIKTFSEIGGTQVLILLGEPGIGKTFAIQREQERIGAEVIGRNEEILWPDLQEIETSQDFRRLVTETKAFQDWLRGESTLHLYMDALDECMLRVPTLGRLLTNTIKDGPADRLWLRLTCRTAEWSNELETALKRTFGNDRLSVFELLPLTKEDVASAIEANSISAHDFFEYVQQTGSSALASRPVPLDFLIRCFLRGDLPSSQPDLYERGCLALCQESEHRQETGLSRILTDSERLAVAKRIAACTIFSRRSVILLGHDDADVPTDAVRLSELIGGQETLGDTKVAVSEKSLRDTIDTGLFTSRRAKTMGWAHHTYQEYLAARYLNESNLATEQILALIVHPDDPDRKLTPQLHGIAAWLAVLNQQIFKHVAEHEPELLLLSDAVVERNDDRAFLVGAIIRREREGTLRRMDALARFRMRKLSHPGIADQLRPVLTNSHEPSGLRELVASIAKYTKCYLLASDLVGTALDTAQPIGVRVDAASAAIQLGDEGQRAALKPLMEGPPTSREERWLIRLGLKAAWPHALSADELFTQLDSKRRRLGFIYDDYVLIDHIKTSLEQRHLVPAAKWVLRRVRALPESATIRLGDALAELEDRIITLAWLSDDPEVTSILAKIAAEKIIRWEPLLSRESSDEEASDDLDWSDIARRRQFASLLLPALAVKKKKVSPWLMFEKQAYLLPEDIEWLAGRQAEVSHTDEEWELESRVLLYLADLTVPRTFEILCQASAHNPNLAEQIGRACAPLVLGSKEAEDAERYYREMQQAELERTRRPRRRKPRKPPFVSHKAEWLDLIVERPCAYWQLLAEMTRKPDTDYVDSMALDVHDFPGWQELDEPERGRVVAAAERFVKECDPDAESWFGTREFSLSAVGGVRALLLLKADAPRSYKSLDGDLWQKWVPALLGIPHNDPNVPLIEDAYRMAPDEVVSRLRRLLRANDTYALHRISDVLDETIVRELISAAEESDVSDETLISLLKPLLTFTHARMSAERWVEERYQQGQLLRASNIAATLMLYAPNESWPVVWPLVSGDAGFGHIMIERAVDLDHHDARPVWTLEEDHLADLYLWLTREYPPEQDPEHEGPYTPDTRDNISMWRSRSLNALTHRGTRAACDALRRIVGELPNLTYLPALLLEAEAATREKTWQPTSISVLRQLLQDSSRRQVRSETELGDVVIQALRRLGQRLQDETPAAFDLWNTAPYKPKSENEFSDYVARFLRDDLEGRGVIIAREVEIRRSASPGGGERTDIHVDVVIEVEHEVRRFSVIVETKGCWNRRLHDDIRDQLAHRYLRENSTRTGVYLVGWFRADRWDTSDPRRAVCKSDPATLTAALETTAAELQKEHFDISVVVLDCSLR